MSETENKAREYETSGEEYWQVAGWEDLVAAFGLREDQLAAWHDVMAGQGRAWEIIRRVFRVSALLDPEPDDLRVWTREDLAGKYGISESLVADEISNAVKEWSLNQARGQVKQGVALISDEEMDHLTRFSNGDGMTEDVISRLLKAFNFDHIQKDSILRAEVASRIVSLKDWLNSPHKRMGARELIRTEISMHGLDSLLVGYQNKLAKLQEDEVAGIQKDAEIEMVHVKISNLEKQMREMSKAHADKQESIGANDLDMTTRKRIYVETVSHLIDQCREYESDPENWKPDGVWTANEINWLLEPSGERDPQYRFDIAMVARDCVMPEHLWDPKYKPPKVTRRVCQELNRLIAVMRVVPKDAEPLPDRDEEEEDGGVADDVATLPISENDPTMTVESVPRPPAAAPMGVF
jgi:hypothetical protein